MVFLIYNLGKQRLSKSNLKRKLIESLRNSRNSNLKN